MFDVVSVKGTVILYCNGITVAAFLKLQGGVVFTKRAAVSNASFTFTRTLPCSVLHICAEVDALNIMLAYTSSPILWYVNYQ